MHRASTNWAVCGLGDGDARELRLVAKTTEHQPPRTHAAEHQRPGARLRSGGDSASRWLIAYSQWGSDGWLPAQ